MSGSRARARELVNNGSWVNKVNELKKKKFLPQTKFEWLVFVSVLIYLAADISSKFLPDYDVATSTEYPLSKWLVLFIRDWSIFIGVGGLIIIGLRAIRINGFVMRKLAIAITGYILCGGLIYFSYNTAKSMDNVIEMITNEKIQTKLKRKIENREFKDKSDANVSRWNKLYAKDKYLTHGVTETYLMPDGSHSKYQPSQKEELEREEFRKNQIWLTNAKNAMERATRNWTIVAILSSLIGLFSPIRKNQLNTQQSAADGR